MKEIIITIAGTVISGVLVFIVSQLILELWIKPKLEHKKLCNRIKYALTYYKRAISNPYIVKQESVSKDFENYGNTFYPQASDDLRKLGSEVSAYKGKKNKEISQCLIGLSNGLWEYDTNNGIVQKTNVENIARILEILK